MQLVVVESPTKAKTLSRFLGKDYQIEASMGHIMDLPKSTLGVDLAKNFKPEWIEVVGKEKIIENLKNKAKSADSIILATDPDREGEAIASHIKDMLGAGLHFSRIVFHEITKEAVLEALKNPRSIDTNLVDAQIARRILDRLVGYKLSPLLWRKVRRGLSAGRVQSIALRLIVEREREIEKFSRVEFFRIFGQFKGILFELEEKAKEKIETSQSYTLYDGEYKVGKTIIDSQKKADELKTSIKSKKFKVADVLQKEVRRYPSPPFTTSTLQQEGNRRLGFSGKKTMALAQKLYEEGFITYHRTDSLNLAIQAQTAIRNFIKNEFGDKFLPAEPRFYKSKQKLAQEAHEAIRPTNVSRRLGDQDIKILGRDFEKLYELVWRRAVASQMQEAIVESTTIYIDSLANEYRFKTTGSVLMFEGFLKVNPQALQDQKLPEFKVGEEVTFEQINSELHETTPPPRYNYASLVATLEEKGIGRPSTYAPIVSTIEERRYIEPDNGRFIPTTVGVAVNDFLVANFSDIDDIPFTAEMEDNLDHVAHGQKKWEPVIREFYTPFEEKLEKVADAPRVKIEVEKSSEICEKCGQPMVVRIGRFGKFLSCSTFPKCDFKKALIEQTEFTCPKCKGKIIIKKTRRGRRFYGCSNYPKCDFAAWKISDIKAS